MSIDHYENFPVASVLCPPATRAAVVAIYRFARTADDIADEGDAETATRIADLQHYRLDLRAVASMRPHSRRWSLVFDDLGQAMRQHKLPLPLLEALLDAFTHDAGNPRYADHDGLLWYCQRSANPVGRLLLHLYGIDDARSLEQSDAICTSLQLINFWQDLGVDLPRGRVYLTEHDLRRYGLNAQQVLESTRSLPDAAMQPLMRELCQCAHALMLQGSSLALRVPGRAGWELRLVVQGGLRILDKTAALGYRTWLSRPRLRSWDLPVLLWRAWRMPALHRAAASQP